MSAVGRDEILRRFEEWLDGALSAAEPPQGIDAEILRAVAGEDGASGRHCDAYALWAAMTTLTQEVKLQGRAFKDLNETLGSQASRIAEEIRTAYRERERDLQREAERRCRREVLSALIDLRDRLGRGLESIRTSKAAISKDDQAGLRVTCHFRASGGWGNWLARALMKPREDATPGALAALTKGYQLGIERLDQTLEEFNACEIRCDGTFDPRRMNAIDREESSAVPEGTVLEVYRSGYEWNGEVFRPAQVKVSCAPAAGKENERSDNRY